MERPTAHAVQLTTRGRERERERERENERERQTDSQTDRLTDRQTDRQRDRQRERERKTKREKNRKTKREKQGAAAVCLRSRALIRYSGIELGYPEDKTRNFKHRSYRKRQNCVRVGASY